MISTSYESPTYNKQMVYSIRGVLINIGEGFAVIECGGVGFKVFLGTNTLSRLPPRGSEAMLFCFLSVREQSLELFGFEDESGLKLFELLNTVSGIGPRTALSVLNIATAPNLIAAIVEKRTDVLTKISGIGKKTAERIILELHNKMDTSGTRPTTKAVEQDHDIEEALVGLGYQRHRVREVLSSIGSSDATIEERLKSALRELSKSRQ